MGLSATQLAVEMGARVIAVDIAPERRELARQFGAAEVIDPTAHDMVAAIRELTHGEGAHKTLDASSAPDRPCRGRALRTLVGHRGASVSAGANLHKTMFAVAPGTYVVFEVAISLDYGNDEGDIKADFASGGFRIWYPVVVFSLLNSPSSVMG